MKLNFFKHKKIFKKETTYKNPDFLWNVLLSLLLIMIIISCTIGFLLFLGVNEEVSTDGVEQTEQIEKVKKDRIDAALNYFEERQQKSADILSAPSPLVDPSL